MKDNDLKYKIRLPRAVARRLMGQLENDANFLYGIGVMDYSLLVGVHNTYYDVGGDRVVHSGGSPTRHTTDSDIFAPNSSFTSEDDIDFTTSRKLVVSRVVGPDSYIMGIIDFAQQWNFSKKVPRISIIEWNAVVVT